MLGYKTSLNEFKMIQIILNVFSDHSVIELKINNKISGKIPKYLELNYF